MIGEFAYQVQMSAIKAAVKPSLSRHANKFPWVTSPFIISAPMRELAGPDLALAVSKAGGLGFLGPRAKSENVSADLKAVKQLLNGSSASTLQSYTSTQNALPVGLGFQLYNDDIAAAKKAVNEHRPCAVWLFAPRDGQAELDEWTRTVREAYPDTQVWIQVGTLREALEAVKSKHSPDVLVIQGTEAGGHGRAKDGLGTITLLPEVYDAVKHSGIPLIAAGGIADGRGIAAALALGASGVVMGTRFLVTNEARISKGYQQELVRTTDGAQNTTRTTIYNSLRGTPCPEQYSPRGVVNRSWHDHQAGVGFEELKRRHEEAAKSGDAGWGPEGRLATYSGAAVGLIHEVEDAYPLVKRLQTQTQDVVDSLRARLDREKL